MSEEKKTRKKKLVIRYLILAACILVIAAITVTTVFAANDWFRHDIVIDNEEANKPNNTDNQGNQGNDGNQGNSGSQNDGNDNQGGNQGDTNEPEKPTTVETTFAYPVASVNVINPYDFVKDVSLGHWHFHVGLDMAASAGTDVVSCLDGTVESIVLDDQLDGNKVTVSHDNGITTVYTFINVKDGLKVGDEIKRGETLGTVSEPTGAEFKQEAHLHFEVLENGTYADPTEYLDLAEK